MASRVSLARARKNRSTSGEGATRSVMCAIGHLAIDASNRFDSNFIDIIEGQPSRRQVDHAAPYEASRPLLHALTSSKAGGSGPSEPASPGAYRPRQPGSPH